jgi:hypothetical protein
MTIPYLSHRLFGLTRIESTQLFSKSDRDLLVFIWLIATCYDSKMNSLDLIIVNRYKNYINSKRNPLTISRSNIQGGNKIHKKQLGGTTNIKPIDYNDDTDELGYLYINDLLEYEVIYPTIALRDKQNTDDNSPDTKLRPLFDLDITLNVFLNKFINDINIPIISVLYNILNNISYELSKEEIEQLISKLNIKLSLSDNFEGIINHEITNNLRGAIADMLRDFKSNISEDLVAIFNKSYKTQSEFVRALLKNLSGSPIIMADTTYEIVISNTVPAEFRNIVCFRTLIINQSVIVSTHNTYFPNTNINNRIILKEIMGRILLSYISIDESIFNTL